MPMNVGFEHHESKIDSLANTCVAMSSGNALFATEVIDLTRQALKSQSSLPVHKGAEKMKEVFMQLHLRRAEDVILAPRGWTLSEFKEHGGQRLPLQAHTEISQLFWQFNLGTDFIVAGVDAHGAHISWVHYNGVQGAGWLESYDKLGFHAIGSGASHAAILLSLGGQHKDLSAAETMYSVFHAKKNAEVAPGVGSTTDLGIISTGGVRFFGPETLARLEEIKEKAESHTVDTAVLQTIYEQGIG